MKKLFVRLFPHGARDVIRFIKNTSLVILGTGILAFAVGFFYIPFNLVTGGSSGLGIVMFNATKLFTPEIWVTIFVYAFFILGLIFLGKHFALQTLVSTLVYPFFLSFASWLASSDMMDGFFKLGEYVEYGGEYGIPVVLAAVFGGAMVGAGSALTFIGGGSTGGSDIIPLIIKKFLPKLSLPTMIFITDASIVLVGMFAAGDLVKSLLGVVAAFVCAISVDKLFLGESSAFIAQIVSDKYKEISDAIIKQMDRTTTIMTVEGVYSGAERKMIMVTFAVKQYAIFSAIVSTIDSKAFITLNRAHEIAGDGWTYNVEHNKHEPDETPDPDGAEEK